MFDQIAERTVQELRAQVEIWQPDVIVRTMTELSGYIVGELLGIPRAVVGNGLLPRAGHVFALLMEARIG